MQPRWAACTSLCHLCQPSAIQWLHSGGSQQRLRLSTPSTLGGWDAVLVWWWQKKIQAYSPRNITRLVEKKRYLQKGAGQRDLSRGAGRWRVWWCVAQQSCHGQPLSLLPLAGMLCTTATPRGGAAGTGGHPAGSGPAAAHAARRCWYRRGGAAPPAQDMGAAVPALEARMMPTAGQTKGSNAGNGREVSASGAAQHDFI